MNRISQCLLFLCLGLNAHAGIRYVKATSSGNGTGTSWANASNDLQHIINISAVNDTIFVAAGIYKPNRPIQNSTGSPDVLNRENSFYFNKNLVVLGGFPAKNNPGLQKRNWVNNPTILSGDIDNNDTLDDDNAFHVVFTTANVDHNFLLDGFTITGGNGLNSFGGGWYNQGGSPSVRYTVIAGNSASNSGGGWFNDGGSPYLLHTSIKENAAAWNGGGWCNMYGSPSIAQSSIDNNSAGRGGGWYNITGNPNLTNTTISGNSAGWGGGWFNNDGDPTLNQTIISGNSAGEGGGWNNAAGNPYLSHTTISINLATKGGGWCNGSGNPNLTQITISGNSASYGGGWFNQGGNPVLSQAVVSGNVAVHGGGWNNANDSPSLNYTTISGNYAFTGGAWVQGSGNPSIINSIVHANTAVNEPGIHNIAPISISYSQVQDYTGSANNNINGNIDPLFIDPQPATLDNPTTAGDYRLQPCSPMIDKSNNNLAATDTADRDGNDRIGTNGGVADLGAYEYQGQYIPRVIHVDIANPAPGNGATWATALNALADAIQFAGENTCVDTILVAKGTYYPEFMSPDGSQNRDKTFYLNRGNLVILGGYETGGGNRDWLVNASIMSGDLDGNDTLDDNNAFHVVMTGGGADTTFLLDGFTITGGKSDYNGAGWYNAEGSPSVSHVIISGNEAGSNGGGWYNDGGNPVLKHTTISDNAADQNGGGWYNWNGSPSINQTNISGNSAYFGGGWYNADGDPSVIDVIINDNTAWGNGNDDRHVLGGGGWFNLAGNPSVSHTTISGNSATGFRSSGGGWHNDGGDPVISHVIISGNSAQFGGAWCNFLGYPSISQAVISGNSADYGGGWAHLGDVPLLNHITISGNSAAFGGGWYNDLGDPSITNSIIAGNTAPTDPDIRIFAGLPSATFSLIQNYTDTSNNNIPGDTDPKFIDLQPATQGNPTTAGNYRLKSCSPLINKGDNSTVPAGVTDLDGNARIWDAANSGITDPGAYELQEGRLWIDTGSFYTGICERSSFTFAGKTYDTAVLESHNVLGKFQTAAGCDSMVRFILEVNDTFITNQFLAINYGQLPYNFGTQMLTQAGTYTETFATVHSCDSTVTLAFDVLYTLSGMVLNDVNGMSNNTINGPGTNAGGLKMVLVHADTVFAWQNVSPSGQFSFIDVPGYNYRLLLTTANISSSMVPTAALPQGWVNTREKKESGNGNDGQVDGMLETGSVTANLTNIRFGIEQPPVAQNNSLPSQLNPGSNATVSLSGSAFLVADPSPGVVKRLHFTQFPSGADIVIINNTGYTSGSWPAQGVEVNATYLLGNLLSPVVNIDPLSGNTDVVLTYRGKDEAGFYSNPVTITMPFRGINISGMVHNNIEGMNGIPTNTITGSGTHAGGLYALLSDDISNQVIATASVNNNGTYTFAAVDKGYYTVRLSTVAITPGTTAATASLPAGWLSTGEKNGSGAGNDGFANATLYLGLQQADNSQVRFGIQQPPVAFNTDQVSALNPGANNLVTVNNAFSSQDAAPGKVTALYFSGSLPLGIERLMLNGTTYSATNPLPPAGVKVNTDASGSPLQNIQLDPEEGSSVIGLNYKAVDASGMMSAAAIATIRIRTLMISGRVYDDLSNSPANIIDGPGTNAGGTLKAVLINNATNKVAGRKNVNANGNFSFSDIAAGTYRIVITTTSTGQNAPAILLPSGWMHTGEYLGNGAGNDGNADGILELGSPVEDINEIRFGIKQSTASGPAQNMASGATGQPNGDDKNRDLASEGGIGTKDALLPTLRIYPNPATDRVYIASEGIVPVRSLRLLDIQGRELRIVKGNISGGMDMSGLAAGNYLLQADLEDGISKRFKVVKE